MNTIYYLIASGGLLLFAVLLLWISGNKPGFIPDFPFDVMKATKPRTLDSYLKPKKKLTRTKRKIPLRYEDLVFFRMHKDSSFGFREPWPDEILVVREEKGREDNRFDAVKIPKFNEKHDDWIVSSADYQIQRGVNVNAFSKKPITEILAENNPDWNFRIRKTVKPKEDIYRGKKVDHKFHVIQLKPKKA